MVFSEQDDIVFSGVYWALNRVDHNCESSVSLEIRASGNIPHRPFQAGVELHEFF